MAQNMRYYVLASLCMSYRVRDSSSALLILRGVSRTKRLNPMQRYSITKGNNVFVLYFIFF